MGTNRKPSYNLESKLESYYSVSKGIAEKYAKLLDMVTDMDKTMKSNIQKVGLIRYNPFDEMGGNLCFALALLDGSDNGTWKKSKLLKWQSKTPTSRSMKK